MKTFKVYIRNNAKLDNVFVTAFCEGDAGQKAKARFPKAQIVKVVEL